MLRFHLLLLTALLLPSASLAQEANATLFFDGIDYPALATQEFGAQFEDGVPFGPHEMNFALDDSEEGDPFDGCGTILNTNQIAGNIALIRRGTCAFVTKAENAANAGAVAVLIYNDDRGGDPNALVDMTGECDPSVCSIPSAFISYATYIVIASSQKFGYEGTITPNFSVAAEEATEVGTYRLASVYPHPVSTTATVEFTLPASEDARVEVFDLLGRRVTTLTDGFRAGGEHTVTLDATGLPSGVYVVCLTTPSTTLSERVTVVR
ncbi:MAG: PA domain-containing protein [Bacteroidota bacterium]